MFHKAYVPVFVITLIFSGLFPVKAILGHWHKQSCLLLTNNTTYKLKITLLSKNHPPYEVCLVPGEFLVEPDPKDIASLKAVPCGIIWKHTQLRKPDDQKEAVQLNTKNNHDLFCSVEPGTSASKALERASEVPLVGKVVKTVAKKTDEYFVPITFHYNAKPIVARPQLPKQPTSITPATRSLADAFPHVVYAKRAGTSVEPYHYLGITSEASIYSIDKEYTRRKEEWEREKALYPNNAEFANKVLNLLELAHRAMRARAELKSSNY